MIRFIDVIGVGNEPKEIVREIDTKDSHIQIKENVVEVTNENGNRFVFPLHRLVWIK